MSDLPNFQQRKGFQVMPLVQGVFGNHFVRLETFKDGHYRVIFKPEYFTMQGDATEPSKSQWSSLKKRIKRRDHLVFIFKEYGNAPCQPDSDNQAECYYVDFGFLQDVY